MELTANNPQIRYSHFDSPDIVRVVVELSRLLTDTEQWLLGEMALELSGTIEANGDILEFTCAATAVTKSLRAIASLLRDLQARALELDSEMNASVLRAEQAVEELMTGRTEVPPLD